MKINTTPVGTLAIITLVITFGILVVQCKPSRHGAVDAEASPIEPVHPNSSHSDDTVQGRSGRGGGGWQTPLNLVDIFAPAQESTKINLIGEIERITVNEPDNVWSSGTMVVAGVTVIIPANLIIQMPVQRYTLQELFRQARSECKLKKQTGLALSDNCFFQRRGAVATILANRSSRGLVIAGQVSLAKANEFITGVVTYINHDQGYFYLNGLPRAESAGVMVRINDPLARHTIQTGKGCDGGVNCSPDQRFPVDSDNYTAAFVTGYPLCVPSTVKSRPRDAHGALTLTFKNGVVSGNDPSCPYAARTVNPRAQPVPDSTHFAPLKVGDSLEATGNFEQIAGVRFFSAHTVRVHDGPTTSPGSPDYVTVSESLWEVAGFPAGRSRSLWLGYTSELLPRLDLFRLAIDPTDNIQHELAMGSTIANPTTVNIGIPPTNIFRMRFKDVFSKGAGGNLSPCVHLANAELPACDDLGTLEPTQNFKIMSPISREALIRTRNKTENPTLVSFDLSGNEAPNGVYQFPVGVEHPYYLEINLNRIQTPFLFTGEPWNLDRRLGPQGCGGDRGGCDQPAALTPFPYDGGLDPGNQVVGINPVPVGAVGRITSGYPYDNRSGGPALPWQSTDVDTATNTTAESPLILRCQ